MEEHKDGEMEWRVREGEGGKACLPADFYLFLFLFLYHQEDDPLSVVERVAEGNVLDSAMRTVLLARIRREMDKRCNKR